MIFVKNIVKIIVCAYVFSACDPLRVHVPHPREGVVTLYYEQGFCGNPWGAFSTNADTVFTHLSAYFASNKFAYYQATLSTTVHDSCVTCNCKSGNLILLSVKNTIDVKQKFYAVGFRDYNSDSIRLAAQNRH